MSIIRDTALKSISSMPRCLARQGRRCLGPRHMVVARSTGAQATKKAKSETQQPPLKGTMVRTSKEAAKRQLGPAKTPGTRGHASPRA